ncbi:hypothetical protein MXB_4192, partial [Myxobolus squamalis]
SFNFGLLYICAPVVILLIGFISSGLTFSLGALLVSVSLFIAVTYPRPANIIIFFGVLVGLGTSFIFHSTLYVLKTSLFNNLTLANGIISSGACAGTLVQSFVIGPLCTKYTLKTVFMMYSAFIFIFSLTSFGVFMIDYLKKSRNKIIQTPKNNNDKQEVLELMKNKKFILLCSSCFIFCFGYLIIYFYIQIYYISIFSSAKNTSNIIGYFFLGSFIGRIFFGVIATYTGEKIIYLLIYGIAKHCFNFLYFLYFLLFILHFIRDF